jgi:hypothetical protein
MAVTTPKETQTESPIADLGKKMEAGFARVDEKMEAGFARVDSDIRELRRDTKAGFEKSDEKVEKLDGKMAEGFARVDTRFYWLIFTLLAAAGGIIAALLATHPG